MAGHVANTATKFEDQRLFILDLWVITFPIGYHWKCVCSHSACAESRDRWVGGQKQLYFWNPRPRFAYSLHNFYGLRQRLSVVYSRAVGDWKNPQKRKKPRQKGAQNRACTKTKPLICIKFCRIVGIPDVITHAIFGYGSLMGFGWRVSKFPIPHRISSSPLQHSCTIVRVCDDPINYTLGNSDYIIIHLVLQKKTHDTAIIIAYTESKRVGQNS